MYYTDQEVKRSQKPVETSGNTIFVVCKTKLKLIHETI